VNVFSSGPVFGVPVDTIPATVVRDTLATIIGSGDYARGVGETLLSRLLGRLESMWDAFIRMGGESPAIRWLSIGFLALLVLSVIARVVWLWVQERRAIALLERTTGARLADGEDPLAAARRAAENGDHTVASHLLYRALLMRISASEKVRLHPAKTAGDYARELRSRNSAAAVPFRQFARAYERAVYGIPVVDAATWHELHDMAEPLLA